MTRPRKVNKTHGISLLHADINGEQYMLQIYKPITIPREPIPLREPRFAWLDKDNTLIDQPEIISLDPRKEIACFSAALISTRDHL